MRFPWLTTWLTVWLVALSACVRAAPISPPQPAASLHLSLNDDGLSELSYNGTSLLLGDRAGQAAPVNATPVFVRDDGTTYLGSDKPLSSALDKTKNSVTRVYGWGSIICTYEPRGDALWVRTRIENHSRDRLRIDVQLLEATFAQTPQGQTLDAGMFGQGGALHPLSDYPLAAPPEQVPPVILIEFGAGALAFCDEISPTKTPQTVIPATIGVPFSSNSAKTRFPFWITPPSIGAGRGVETLISLRFGPSGATVAALAPDVLMHFAARFPRRLVWNDRRAIGTLFLSTSEAHPALNPRGWFSNASDIDTTTPQGRQAWRGRLLDYADSSIKILKAMNAQGMVTWNPTGDAFGTVSFDGDPTQIDTLAPETLTQGNPKGNQKYDAMAAIDAYFAKFRDAGFRVGVCVRPQELRFVNGVPAQNDSPDPGATLARKIAYARRRWGCTLFYIDSTVDARGPLPPEVLERVAKQFPDVLLMPENEAPRYFATTAPFNSFFHHGVTSTPAVTRSFYPQAFSAIYAPEGDIAKHCSELLAAVKRGDILLFHAWYNAPANALLKSIIDEANAKNRAAQKKPAKTPPIPHNP